MPSKSIFRNRSQVEDGAQFFFVANTKETATEISGLKTFSCEADEDPIEIFDSTNYFEVDQDNGSENKPTKGPRQEHDHAPIVTPQLANEVVDIAFDPLPESEINPLLLGVGDSHRHLLPETESELLFPLAEEDFLNMVTIDCKASVLENVEEIQEDDKMSHDGIVKCNLQETSVYKLLQPSLSLPDSFGPILSLLLHMEFSSTIDGTVLEKACEIVNEQWKTESSKLCGKVKKKDAQTISGKIVDALVEVLGSAVDLPVLFQASAQTCNNLSAADRFSVFFQKETSAIEKANLQDRDNTNVLSLTPDESIGGEGDSGKKRKSRMSDDDKKMPSKKPAAFVPTVLQLAIAYGATCSAFSHDISDGDRASLEEFVERTAGRLQDLDSTERKYQWNDLHELWQSRK